MGASSSPSTRPRRVGRLTLVGLATLAMLVSIIPAALAQDGGLPTSDDPRVGLAGGFLDAETASLGMDLTGQFQKPDGDLFNPASIGSFDFAGSDLAFTGDHVIHGNFGGFQIINVADPDNPVLRTQVICPGGQGDASVFGDLLFISVEQTRAQVDCTLGPTGGTNPNRFRGLRIFDISDLDNPEQVATVQTCRGSHTHRLVEDLNDPSRVYIYINGTNNPRSGTELDGCSNPSTSAPNFNEDSSRFSIDIIEVPLDAPEEAAIVNQPRLFTDEETGAINGLWPGGSHGPGLQSTSQTDACHDITVYPEIGLAAGACEGNGILLDISDPANPIRIDEVIDPTFAYWHSANFNNDGTAVMFTDEWGGGTGARCRATDPLSWGANGLYHIVDTDEGKKLEFASHYKMPAVQTSQENCVAHQANVVPVPGRDIIVQAWYQGGLSMFDWSDPENPFEIGYFDRGPINVTNVDGNPTGGLVLGGFWSGYWYNGQVFGAEIARGLDVFDLVPTEHLTENEIAAAKTVQVDELNPMSQFRIEWAPSFEVVRAYTDQAERAGLKQNHLDNVRRFVDRAEQFSSGPQARAAIANLRAVANQVDAAGDFDALAGALRDLADSLG
jgi:hypothetical protein